MPAKTTKSNNMRYLHVISSMDPRGGGPAEGVRQLARTGVRLGIEVEVVTLDAPDSAWNRNAGFPIHELGPRRLGTYGYAPRLRPWLADHAHRYDAVVVDGIWQYHSYATWKALRRSMTPYFVFTHGMLDPWFRREYPLKHAKKWLYWPWAEYRVLRDAQAVLFTCEEERLQARQSFPLYRANEAVVGYGTPGVEGDAVAQRAAFLEAFPALRDKRLLLFLGRIHPKKGVDLLVNAFAEAADAHPELHLMMAGPDAGNAQSDLMRGMHERLSGRVSWPGMLVGDLKWGAFRCAEAFVLPSHQENFGIAVAEALSCGLPVLISNKVNIWREIERCGAGLVAEDTAAGTRQLLTRWMSLDGAHRERMGTCARSCFVQRFHVVAAAESLLETLRLSQRAGREVAA